MTNTAMTHPEIDLAQPSPTPDPELADVLRTCERLGIDLNTELSYQWSCQCRIGEPHRLVAMYFEDPNDYMLFGSIVAFSNVPFDWICEPEAIADEVPDQGFVVWDCSVIFPRECLDAVVGVLSEEDARRRLVLGGRSEGHARAAHGRPLRGAPAGVDHGVMVPARKPTGWRGTQLSLFDGPRGAKVTKTKTKKSRAAAKQAELILLVVCEVCNTEANLPPHPNVPGSFSAIVPGHRGPELVAAGYDLIPTPDKKHGHRYLALCEHLAEAAA